MCIVFGEKEFIYPFSQVSVYPQGGEEEVCIPCQAYTPPGRTPPLGRHPHPQRWLLQRTVRILLECILVLKKTSQHNRTLKTDFRSVLKQINLKKSSYLSSGRALTASTHTAKFCLLPINFCSESTTCC